jgi:hypothetical protein
VLTVDPVCARVLIRAAFALPSSRPGLEKEISRILRNMQEEGRLAALVQQGICDCARTER